MTLVWSHYPTQHPSKESPSRSNDKETGFRGVDNHGQSKTFFIVQPTHPPFHPSTIEPASLPFLAIWNQYDYQPFRACRSLNYCPSFRSGFGELDSTSESWTRQLSRHGSEECIYLKLIGFGGFGRGHGMESQYSWIYTCQYYYCQGCRNIYGILGIVHCYLHLLRFRKHCDRVSSWDSQLKFEIMINDLHYIIYKRGDR